MTQKTIQGNSFIAKKIKERRNELGMTIEEAASKAGVGTKTWCRYEAGESIRKDKCKGICRALSWYKFPHEDDEDSNRISLQEYRKHEAWSEFLESAFGAGAAIAFAVGSDLLDDHLREDLEALKSQPRGTHIGQLDISWLMEDLPPQFLMEYDYDFLYRMKCKLNEMRRKAKWGEELIAHSVLEELILYLCNQEAAVYMELTGGVDYLEEDEEEYDTEEWLYDLLGDMDIVTFLYSGLYVNNEEAYHYNRWNERQFYCEEIWSKEE
ncbi:MAG: helix-turn-helix transcriptional regulator [Firmicutes bacterium]|nr:helix-turn-helix transcriptional regulator [Bacillota bacterium]